MNVYQFCGVLVIGYKNSELPTIQISNVEEFTSRDTPAMAIRTDGVLSAQIATSILEMGLDPEKVTPNYLILVNESIIRDKKAWDACLCHEYGHIVNGDLEEGQPEGRHLDKELAADRYACVSGRKEGSLLLLRQLIVIVWISKMFSWGQARKNCKASLTELKTRLTAVKAF